MSAQQKLFDKVYVISLPSSTDRREYINKHLPEMGFPNFEFHDALGPDSEEVRSRYASNGVFRYPPCFRCGKLRCDNEDCNNVLVPTQVAVFETYLKLWKNIARVPQRALIVEDDVVFHDYSDKILDKLARDVSNGWIIYRPDRPRLLRLGWALCDDHNGNKPYRLRWKVQMSNPCHAITTAFAQALLDRFRFVNQTADVYQHKRAPRFWEALTIYPPIASERSWSTGEVSSLIHPKLDHVKHLSRIGAVKEAQEHEEKLRAHIKHIYHRPFLITGHPGSGNSFAAKLMQQLGFDIGLDRDGNDGVCSWPLAVTDNSSPCALDQVSRTRKALHWDWLLHHVRDPATAIPSIIPENCPGQNGFEFRRRHILSELGHDLLEAPTELDRAVRSLVYWSRIIQRQEPALTIRIEEPLDSLLKFLKESGFKKLPTTETLNLSLVREKHGQRGAHQDEPQLTPLDWSSVDDETWRLLEEYCELYQYSLPTRS